MPVFRLCSERMGPHPEFPQLEQFCDKMPGHDDGHRAKVIERDYLNAKIERLEAALLSIRQATNLALPIEQTGPEWETTVRVPLARLEAIDAAVASVLGESQLTGEPMPKLHGGEGE